MGVHSGVGDLLHQHLAGLRHGRPDLLQYGVHLGHVGVGVGLLGGGHVDDVAVDVGVDVALVVAVVLRRLQNDGRGGGCLVVDDAGAVGGGGVRGLAIVVGQVLLQQDVGVVGGVDACGAGGGGGGGEDASAAGGGGDVLDEAGDSTGRGEVAPVLRHKGLHQVRLEGTVAGLNELLQFSHGEENWFRGQGFWLVTEREGAGVQREHSRARAVGILGVDLGSCKDSRREVEN